MFGPGITAIVGPNGCGKSNLSDAILWALGEQSTKALRSDRMDEVIFNGTEKRKPVGMAEVSLTFEDLAGEVSPPYDTYTELTVTRRLFRSGESEYLINRTACRLRDIRELLVDTGAGLKGYSVIEQGRVEALVNLSPLDRRAMVEEAAGVAKYKMRRLEAERKMVLTSQNLVRVTDILAEISLQAGVLKRQAKQAQDYQRLTAEIGELVRRRAHLEWVRLKAEWSRLDADGRGLADQMARAKADQQRLEREALTGRDERQHIAETLTKHRQVLLDLERELSRREALAEALKTQQQTSEEVKAREDEEIAELTRDVEALAGQVGALEREVAEAAPDLAEQRRQMETRARESAVPGQTPVGQIDQVDQEIEAQRKRTLERAAAIATEHNRVATSEARQAETRTVRRRIQHEREGLQRARAQAEHGLRPADVPGIRAVVTDLLRTPQAIERAIEAVLGERLAGLVMEDGAAIQAALPGLRAGLRPHTLLPRRPRQARPARPTRGRPGNPGVLGAAAELVESDPADRPLLEYLLGDVVICRDLEVALKSWESDQDGLTWVTTDGLIVGPGGEVSWRVLAPDSLVAEIRQLKDRLATLDAEEARLLEDDARSNREAAAAREALARLKAEQREGDERVTRLQADLQRRRADLEAARTVQVKAQVGAASLEARLHHLQAERDRARATHEQRLQQWAKRQAAIQAAAAARATAARTLEETQAKIVTLRRTREAQHRVIEEHDAALRRGEERRRSVEEALHRQRAVLDDLQRRIHEIEVARATLQVRIETLQTTHPGVGDQPEQPEAAGDPPDDVGDPVEAEGRLTMLRQRLQRLGAVNLAAVEEFQTLEARQATLTSQEADLRQSLADLEAVITTINETIEERFVATFEALAARFQETFATFFGGGQARLILLDPAHPLESGVEVIAQPPGKRQVNLLLLSGGEKALTAIALIFAGFGVRPSPFYILDEVDAPLDDQNIRRFAGALKPMAARAQLLVVTHSKLTMEAADCLYGVTMEEAGVSKLIGVRLSPAAPTTHTIEQVPA